MVCIEFVYVPGPWADVYCILYIHGSSLRHIYTPWQSTTASPHCKARKGNPSKIALEFLHFTNDLSPFQTPRCSRLKPPFPGNQNGRIPWKCLGSWRSRRFLSAEPRNSWRLGHYSVQWVLGSLIGISSMKLKYPTLGKGKSSSKVRW